MALQSPLMLLESERAILRRACQTHGRALEKEHKMAGVKQIITEPNELGSLYSTVGAIVLHLYLRYRL